MSEHWEFFPCTIGDAQASICVDVGIKDEIKAKAPSVLMKVRLAYKEPHPNGLPTNAELQPVGEIEDRLGDFTDDNEDWYVGRITLGGYRIFYVYTDTSKERWETFLETVSKETNYELKLSFHDDKEHKGYWEELYPTEDDWQIIQDLRVIEVLREHGDDGSKVRKIEHWAYFDTQDMAKPFIEWAESEKFTYDAELSSQTDDGQFCVRLFHKGSVWIDDIGCRSISLRRKAAEFGGLYDGWETQVATEDEE